MVVVCVELDVLPWDRNGCFRPFLPDNRLSAVLKDFSRREAYESLGRPNPRHQASVMGNLQLAHPMGEPEHTGAFVELERVFMTGPA